MAPVSSAAKDSTPTACMAAFGDRLMMEDKPKLFVPPLPMARWSSCLRAWKEMKRCSRLSFRDDVLFGDVWERAELSKRDRSLITVAALITGGNTEQLSGHLMRAKGNGLTETELKEVIIHLAFYAGWPKAMSALTVAKQIFEGES